MGPDYFFLLFLEYLSYANILFKRLIPVFVVQRYLHGICEENALLPWYVSEFIGFARHNEVSSIWKPSLTMCYM